MKDYKRLTERDEFGNADIIGLDSHELANGLHFDELNKLTSALNRFAELEDKIESGEIVDRNAYLDYLMAAKNTLELTDKEIEFFAKHNARIRKYVDEDITRLTAENDNLTVELEVAQRDIDNLTRTLEEANDEIKALEAENVSLQKRLDNAVELPCKVGDTVYSVFEFPNEKTVLKGTCNHININICNGFPEIFIKLVFESNEQIFLRTYSGNALNNIFLLRSDAEARLAELKEGEQ